ncbi:MAG: 30S ribosomal protein S7 [Candidatus Hodgkinia cicadicola]
MSRKRRAKRPQLLCSGSDNAVLAKLTNYLMISGNKNIASKILYNALVLIEYELLVNPVKVLYEALDNIAPYSEVRSKKVGGVSYQVPVDLPSERRLSLALKWLVSSARRRKEATMWVRLAREIIESVSMVSTAYKKGQAVRELVCANQAFSHLGW